MPAALMLFLLLDNDSRGGSSENAKPFKEKPTLLKTIWISSASCITFSFVRTPDKQSSTYTSLQITSFASGYPAYDFDEISVSAYST